MISWPLLLSRTWNENVNESERVDAWPPGGVVGVRDGASDGETVTTGVAAVASVAFAVTVGVGVGVAVPVASRSVT